MAVLQREFCRSARGSTPDHEDSWWLICDADTNRLFVRHQWVTAGHDKVAEFDLAEFLKQKGTGQVGREVDYLIDALFNVSADA